MLEAGHQFDSRESREQHQEVASSTDGKIKEVLVAIGFSLNGYRENSSSVVVSQDGDIKGGENAGYHFLMIKNLLQTLPPEVRLKVVVQAGGLRGSSKTLLEDWRAALQSVGLDSRRIDWEIIENRFQNLNKDWIRDYFLLSADGKKMYLPQSGQKSHERMGEYLYELADSLGLEIVKCPFTFEGGDIKSADGKMYVSMETIRMNLRKNGILTPTWNKCKDILDNFSNFFGTEVTLVGADYWQKEFEESGAISAQGTSHNSLKIGFLFPPLFHLDLYYTPLGNNQVAIGDVSLMLDTLRREDGNNWWERGFHNFKDSADASMERKKSELADFSNVREFQKRLEDPMKYLREELKKNDFSFEKPYQYVQDYLDSVARESASHGLEVIRVPILPASSRTDSSRTALITYNNCLVENFSDGDKKRRRMWLPSYGASRRTDEGGRADVLNLLDKEASEIFRGAGLEVQKIDSGLENTIFHGSLNCRLMEFRET